MSTLWIPRPANTCQTQRRLDKGDSSKESAVCLEIQDVKIRTA